MKFGFIAKHRGSGRQVGCARRSVSREAGRPRSQRSRSDDPYVYLDGIVLKRSWAGEVRNVWLFASLLDRPPCG